MDPISFGVELELGTFLLAIVGGLATWLHNRHSRERRRQQDRHFQQSQQLQEQMHREHMAAIGSRSRLIGDLASAAEAESELRGRGARARNARNGAARTPKAGSPAKQNGTTQAAKPRSQTAAQRSRRPPGNAAGAQ